MSRLVRVALGVCSFAAALLLGACGGGGGGGGSSGSGGPVTPAASYTLSVGVSGLRGQLVLASRVGPDVTVSANGDRVLGTATAGTAYTVSVVTQPAGQLCTASSGAGTLVSQDVRVQVSCVNQLTAANTALRGGEFVLLDGAPATTAPATLQGQLAGRGPVSVQRVTDGIGFLVPDIAPGAQVLTVLLGGDAYEFRFQLGPRSASAPTPSQTFAAASATVAQSLAVLETSGNPGRAAAVAGLRLSINDALAQAATLSESDRRLMANFLEAWQAGLATAAAAQRQYAQGSGEQACIAGGIRIRSNMRRATLLITAAFGVPTPPWFRLAAVVAAGVAVGNAWDYIDNYLFVECFNVDQVVVELEQDFELTSGASGSSGAAAFRLKRPAAGSDGRAQALAATAPASVQAMHDVPVRLRGAAQASLPAVLRPTVADLHTLLPLVSFLLPDVMISGLAQWTESFTRTIDLSRYAVASVSSPRVRYSAAPGEPGVLKLRLAYLPGPLPAQAERFDVVLNDRYSREQKVAVTLSLPALPTLDAATLQTAPAQAVTGTFVSTGARGFRIVGTPTQGAVVLAGGGSGLYTYTPNSGASGIDSFTAVATNEFGDSQPAVFAIQINRAATVVRLAATPNPVEAGGTITFTATVAAVGALTGAPSGSIVLTSNNLAAFPGCTMQIGPAGVAGCVVAFAATTSGSASYVARYGGDTIYLGSASAGLTVTVDPGPLPCETTDQGAGGQRMLCYYPDSNRLRSLETLRRQGTGVIGYFSTFRDEPGQIPSGAVTYALNDSYALTYLNTLGFAPAMGSGVTVEGSWEPGLRSSITHYVRYPDGRAKSTQNYLCVVPTATGDGAHAYYERYWDAEGNVLYDASGNDNWNIREFPVSQCPTQADVEAVTTANFREGGLYKLYVPR